MRDKTPYRYPAAIIGGLLLVLFLFVWPAMMEDDAPDGEVGFEAVDEEE